MGHPLVQATGRRKRAVARVRVRHGSGQITVNNRPVEAYFPNETHRMVLAEQIAVQDMLALADVLLLPEDDLSLAALLKSPLASL